MAFRVTQTLYNALKTVGFELPPECGDLRLEMPVDGLMRLHYVENLTGERLAQFGRALAMLGDVDDPVPQIDVPMPRSKQGW